MFQFFVRPRRILGALALGLLLAGAIAIEAKAPPCPNTCAATTVTSKPPKLRADRQLFQAPKAPAIPFKPFVLQDAKGNSIDPSTTITWAKGIAMPAGDYLTQLNDLEKMLNARGQTLLKPGSKTKTIANVISSTKLSRVSD
jgi:hypothetical protein